MRLRPLAVLAGATFAALLSPRETSAQVSPPDTGSARGMMMPGILGIPMERSASGTAWIPDAAPVPSRNFMAGTWDLMLHGFAFVQYDHQGGPRGNSQLGSVNWAMLMATHDLAGGRLQLRSMLSLDAAGVGKRGYPELLQTGENFGGEPLHDWQHPHDFFMELAALYDRAISRDLGIELYLAPSGEPALGAEAFMHRPSGVDNPAAPSGHHWQDASHTSFGVATAGLFTRRWKFEGSIFNGRDPDSNRWRLEFHPLDSYSGRATFNPVPTWNFSAGYGFLRMPEVADPGHSMHRTVLSVQHGKRIGDDGQWASTLMWGANAHSDEKGLSSSALAESELILDAWNTLFTRVEFVQKTADDLGLSGGPAGFPANRSFDLGNFSLGYVRELTRGRGVTLGIGILGSLNVVPADLVEAYGSRMPLGVTVYLRLRALRSDASPMAGMEGMKGMRPDPRH